jgi:nonsense-mediated mRNA decay protein 3
MKCVLCGRESEERLCPECYIQRNEIVLVDDIYLIQCPRCGHFKMVGRWRDINFYEALQKEVKKHTHIHPGFILNSLDLEENREYRLLFRGNFRGLQVELPLTINLNLNKELCWKCRRESGGYYESIIQLRAENRKLTKDEIEGARRLIEEEIYSEVENPRAFISKVVERKEGIDYYLGSKEIGKKVSRKIIHEFGGKIKESKKISGRADGRDIYRFTYLVRLPAFKKGDFVRDKDILAIVTNQKIGKGITLNGKSITLHQPVLIAEKKDLRKAFVLNSDSYVAEILHPDSNEVIMVENSWNLKAGDSAVIVEHRNKYYAFPERLFD